MTAEITTEKARIGAPSIAGFTEEGEGLVAAKVDHGHNHGVTVMSSRAERLTSFNVADFPLPTGREEEWRFSPVRGLANLLSDTATDLDPAPAADFTVEAPEGYVRSPLAQPTAPSIWSSISRLSSSAYSIGSSRAIGSMNPRTIIAIAASSVSPRLMR